VAGVDTKHQIVEAAFEALRRNGYARASARAIAATGGFNQALVFYHFGTVDDLLVAALDRSSEARLERYRERFAADLTLPELIRTAAELYREDTASGHIRILAELMAAGSASPELGRKVAQRVEPWREFVRETFTRVMGHAPLSLVAAEDAAFALTSLYLGMELLTNLSGDSERVDAVFASAERLATLLSAFLPGAEGAPS
jgi:AcrR family transcriptional regulator